MIAVCGKALPPLKAMVTFSVSWCWRSVPSSSIAPIILRILLACSLLLFCSRTPRPGINDFVIVFGFCTFLPIILRELQLVSQPFDIIIDFQSLLRSFLRSSGLSSCFLRLIHFHPLTWCWRRITPHILKFVPKAAQCRKDIAFILLPDLALRSCAPSLVLCVLELDEGWS